MCFFRRFLELFLLSSLLSFSTFFTKWNIFHTTYHYCKQLQNQLSMIILLFKKVKLTRSYNKGYKTVVISLNSNAVRFLIGGEPVTFCGSQLTNLLGRAKPTIATSWRKEQHEDLTRTWLGHAPWIQGNLWVSRCKANDFFALF